MIKIKAFKPEEYEAANKFTNDHPRTEGDKSVLFCNNYILVTYEDGNLFPVAEQKTRFSADLVALLKEAADAKKDLAIWQAQFDAFEPKRIAAVEKLKEGFDAYVKTSKDDNLRKKVKSLSQNGKDPNDVAKTVVSIAYKDPEAADKLHNLHMDVEMYRGRASEANISVGMHKGNIEILNVKIGAVQKLIAGLADSGKTK